MRILPRLCFAIFADSGTLNGVRLLGEKGLVMKLARILGASAVVGVCAGLVAVSAHAKVRVIPYTKSGPWKVQAVYGHDGAFNHCSASTRYESGTRVSIIVYRSGNWRLWFSHSAWPSRPKSAFPATVRVDGRVVLSQRGFFSKRNAYINLGKEVSRVRALMQGRAMAVSTPAGTSRFKLTGTNQATRQIVGCWKAHYRRRPSGGGAFGSASNNSGASGAFGGGATTRRRSVQLSRASTLEIAARYLSKASQPYSILPREKNPLKQFPVNWKYQSGAIGGMRVFKNTSADVNKLLGVLLSNQAKNCKGRNASQREPAKVLRGRRMVRARGVCETSRGTVLKVTYKVAELGRRMVMLVMEVRAAGVPAVRGRTGVRRPSPNAGGDGGIRIPGPDEL
jgi:hypothetical protein